MVKEFIKDFEQLSKRAVEWDVRGNQELSIQLVQDLEDTLNAHNEIAYVCANELGYRERAIDMRFSDDTYVFFNPIFQKVDKLVLSKEYDRYDGKEYIVPRYNEIEIVYQDCLGAPKAAKFTDVGALFMGQAMDTLDGLYAHDYGLEVIPEFVNASEEEQNEVIKAYLNSFSDAYNKLDKELSNNEETRGPWKAAKFIEGVNNGSVKLEEEKKVSKRKQKKLNKMIKDLKQQANRLKFWRKK